MIEVLFCYGYLEIYATNQFNSAVTLICPQRPRLTTFNFNFEKEIKIKYFLGENVIF